MNYDTSNEMFRLAAGLVNHSATNIFLTGKAGTGKTTFLKYIRENCPKQMAVVAPTGVAAINAGGVTIHSFFQLPLSPFIPEVKGFRDRDDETVNPHSLLSRLKMTNDKKRMLQELELLIIDEISMVRCDILDEIDLVLRHIRHRHREQFGGVQLLFIGDMFQLPPVIKNEEWKILSGYYSGPFFFDSKVVQQSPPVYVEFNKIYRQSEENFINLLNQVRNNDLNEDGRAILLSRYQPRFTGNERRDHIILTTHNEKARNINITELEKLPSDPVSYTAAVDGDFPASFFPVDESLQLKVGAKVMFVKNDGDKSKRYFNGKIGEIVELTADKILVQCTNEPSPIEVKKETWENIRYRLNKSTRQLDEDVLGSFTQYPLRLAWAITIHKSQGLTFDKAIIDAGNAFAAGQVYVALSRCTNLEGLVLYSHINSNSLLTDSRIVQFAKTAATTEKLAEELEKSRVDYQLRTLLALFDFSGVINETKTLQQYVIENSSSFNKEAVSWIGDLRSRIFSCQQVSEKFHSHLKFLFAQNEKPEENAALQERIKAAATFFLNDLAIIIDLISKSPAITDSRMHAKEYNDGLKEIFVQLSLKKFLLGGFGETFSMEAFQVRKKLFSAPAFFVNAYAGATQKQADIAHPVLHQQLRKLRDSICLKKDLPIYIVAGSRTLEEMATYLPQNIEELEQISGFGKVKLELYGKQFLEIITRYCAERNLSSSINEKSAKRKRKENKESKPDTKGESFRLYKLGKPVVEIARERNLTKQTIEGHLSYFVQQGLIQIEELVSDEKRAVIEPAIKDLGDSSSLTTIKEKLDDSISYGEIKLVLAWQDFQKAQRPI